MKHYYTGKGGKAELLANDQMLQLIDLNILFDDELKKMGEYVMVGMATSQKGKLSSEMRCGWTPNKVAEITNWFTGKYLQSLCRTNNIDHNITDGGYLITAKGVGQLYEKYLIKEKR